MVIYLHEGSGHIKARKEFDKYAHPMEHLGISWKHVLMFSLRGLILGFGGSKLLTARVTMSYSEVH